MKIYVTGAGIISALGIGTESTLDALKQRKSGIGKIAVLATEHHEFPTGEIPLTNAEMASMLNAGYPDNALRTVMAGRLAAREAILSAGLTCEELAHSIFISGTTVGGMDNTERHFGNIIRSGNGAVESEELRYHDCGYCTEAIADSLGKLKSVTTLSTACSSAANAIILGANMIKAGMADIVIAGGSEALSRFHLNGFNSLMILDKECCRPFEDKRNGINLGEGAGYIVLESEKSTEKRRAKILAELSGYGNACDAFHQTATSENGEGAYLAMSKALEMAGLAAEDIDYINAHGTGTPNNDSTELAAMHRIWNEKLPPFSSTKSYTGHTTSASGGIESVISLLAIREGFIPENPEKGLPGKKMCECSGKSATERKELLHVLCNSFGFGGNDSSLIFSKVNGKDE